MDALVRSAVEAYLSKPSSDALLDSANDAEARQLRAALLLMREGDEIRRTNLKTALDNFMTSREESEGGETAEDARAG